MAGVSRSATAVIGYLMWKNGIPFHEARRHVAAVRPWICPNHGFQQQLLAFQDAGCKLEM
jgi:protein-tyrosine phosphatase